MIFIKFHRLSCPFTLSPHCILIRLYTHIYTACCPHPRLSSSSPPSSLPRSLPADTRTIPTAPVMSTTGMVTVVAAVIRVSLDTTMALTMVPVTADTALVTAVMVPVTADMALA